MRELLGPPGRVDRSERLGRDIWTYQMAGRLPKQNVLYVQLSFDGVVREVLLLDERPVP